MATRDENLKKINAEPEKQSTGKRKRSRKSRAPESVKEERVGREYCYSFPP